MHAHNVKVLGPEKTSLKIEEIYRKKIQQKNCVIDSL